MEKFLGKCLVYLIKQQFRQHNFMEELSCGGMDAGKETQHSVMNNLKFIYFVGGMLAHG